MSIAESITLTDGVSGPAAAAAAAVGQLGSALKGLNGASAGGAAAEVASIKSNAALRMQQDRQCAAAALSQQKAIQSAILASQKASHARELANIKAEGAARLAEVKANADAAKAAAQEGSEAAQASAGGGAAAGGGGSSALTAVASIAGPAMQAARLAVRAVTYVGEQVYAAYEKAAAVIEGLGLAGGHLALAATTAHDELVGVFKAEGKSSAQAEALYNRITAQSIATGRSKEALAGEYKRLAAAGFKDDALRALTKMLGDEGAVAGEGKANTLEKLLTKVQNKGSLDKGTYSAFTRQFGSQDALNKELAKELNKRPADIAALLKQGKINASVAEHAMAKVVEDRVGGAAAAKANTVLGLIGRIQTALEDLFVVGAKAQAPIKTFLNNVLGDLVSYGPALKDAANDVFKSAFGSAFDGLNSKTGKGQLDDMFKGIVRGAHLAAAEIRALKKPLDDLIARLDRMTKDGTLDNIIKAGGMVAKEKIRGVGDDAKSTATTAAVATGKSNDWLGTSSTVQGIRRHLGINPNEKMGLGGTILNSLTAGLYAHMTGQSRDMIGETGVGGKEADFSGLGSWDPRSAGVHTESDGSVAAKAAAGKKAPAAKAAAAAPMPIMMSAANDNGPAATSAAGLPDAVTSSMTDSMTESGTGIGNALNLGMAQGIEDSMDASLAAGGTAATQLIARVKAILGIHSPSTVFRDEIGGNIGAGLALGISGSAHHANRAAGALAKGVVHAGSGGGGGTHITPANGNGGGGGAGGGPVVINMNIQLVAKPGASPAQQGQEAGEAAEKALRSYMRKRAVGG